MPHLTLIQLVVVSLVAGLLLWLLQTKVTFIDGTVKQIVYVCGILIVVLLWVVFLFAAVGL